MRRRGRAGDGWGLVMWHCTVYRRVILTTGLAILYLAACLAALTRLASLWSPSL